jgi:hypothetical protein
MQRINGLIGLLLLATILSGCFSSTAQVPDGGSLSARCQSTVSSADIYYKAMTNTKAEQKTASQVLMSLARGNSRKITIDQANGDQLDTHYSSDHNRPAIQDLAKQLSIVPAGDQAIVLGFQRLHTFGGKNNRYANNYLQAYIVTTGTSDPAILQKLTSAANELKDFACLQVNVIGLDKTHRLKMAEALKPLADRLRFSSSNYQEWKHLVDAS